MTDENVLKSPVSGAPMEEISVQDISLFKDPESGGYWVQADSLKALAELQETPLMEVHTGETTHVHQGRFSPESGEPLLEFEFEEHSGIKIDYDPNTGGIWLDEGELTRLLDYLRDYEDGKFLHHDDEHPHPVERVMMFLYQLTARPPLY